MSMCIIYSIPSGFAPASALGLLSCTVCDSVIEGSVEGTPVWCQLWPDAASSQGGSMQHSSVFTADTGQQIKIWLKWDFK